MMERLRIEYETGYMELNIEAFFPCNSYCTDETRAELLSELREMADGYKTLCDMYREKAEALPADFPERRHWRAQFNKTEVLRKRMENNIRLISGGREG